jgi:hypothetical protein
MMASAALRAYVCIRKSILNRSQKCKLIRAE